MKAQINLVSPESEYFLYTPSKLAEEMFLYPLQCGMFTYLPGYTLKRDSFNSFLLVYIMKGELELELPDWSGRAEKNSFILIDCYQHHAYSSKSGCECLWCHFDGLTARSFYENIILRSGHVFSFSDSYTIYKKMSSLYKIFSDSLLVREPLLSKYLNDILTEFMLYSPSDQKSATYRAIAEDTMTYINEHFTNELTVENLASRVGLSLYHFIRTFKKETGFTPHEYLLNTRLASAGYLLKNTSLSIKDICFRTGFSGESVFCTAFKHHYHLTPSQYRMENSI